MLTSLLDKPYKKIVLNRVLKQESRTARLITNLAELDQEVRTHFQEQFRKRNTKLKSMSKCWKEIYEPRADIKEEQYQDIEKKIEEEEQNDMLKELKNGTASGISGISYILIKRANRSTQSFFREFANLCIRVGKIPIKQKIAQIYLIPKGIEWGYNLGNIRPIALIETFRKAVTKIITKRLSKIFMERDILKGSNFAGLPGNSTESPIHMLNMIIENAKKENRELQILF